MGSKKLYAGALILSCAFLFAGCNGAKEEDTSSVLVSGNEIRSYEMAQVKRGDIRKTKVVVANYQQVKTENLSFSARGRRLSGVYVSLGDAVKKGDLLAELICDDEKKNLAELDYQIKTKEMQITHLQEQMDFALEQLKAKKDMLPETTYESEVTKTEDSYRIKMEDLEDQIYIEQLQYDKLEAVVDGCRIYAGMDGTVTYMEEVSTDYFSREGMRFISVGDSDECAFVFDETEYISYFNMNETYVFKASGGEEYETVLSRRDEEAGLLFFELTVPRYDMPLGQRVLYTLVLEEKKDVLYVASSAVHEVDGNSYVYCFDEEGNCMAKQITVGLQADLKVEIIDGLEEGDEVILR